LFMFPRKSRKVDYSYLNGNNLQDHVFVKYLGSVGWEMGRALFFLQLCKLKCLHLDWSLGNSFSSSVLDYTC